MSYVLNNNVCTFTKVRRVFINFLKYIEYMLFADINFVLFIINTAGDTT